MEVLDLSESANCLVTARAIGTIIIVVAVFEIHIDRNAVASINPKIILFGFVPTIEIIERATLL
ncbi:hypothetical protein GCM10007176_08380 [Salinicoccus roseus]|nr:hypothetical protein GCM10007176_08380 [Salinicoccus roseus]